MYSIPQKPKLNSSLIRKPLDLRATLRRLKMCGISTIIIEGAEDTHDLKTIDRAMKQLESATVYVQGFVFSVPTEDALRH